MNRHKATKESKMDRFSKNEQKLFTVFGYDGFMEHIDVLSLYKMAIETAFIDNLTGPAIEALRRGMKAFRHHGVYRHTDEFERLIEFNEELK